MSDDARSESRAKDPPDRLVGTVLAGRYRVLSLIARGAMGKVYRAEQTPLGRVVALKVLAPLDQDDPDDAKFRTRFEREAAMCARLTHPNTVRVYDFGWTDDGLCFIAMEYVDGPTLHHVLAAEAPLPAQRVVSILKQIAGSLGEAHAIEVVHRDLKPGNVLLTVQGENRDFVKVVDFGLVKHAEDEPITDTGVVVGSPMFMSPEQVKGVEIDARTDIYALGVLAYIALTGARPFERDTAIAVLMARLTAPPRPMKEAAPAITVPPSLEWVVMTAMATRPEGRFASMNEVIRALRVCEAELRGDPSVASFTMKLDAQGRTIQPPDFLDPSLVRRTPTPVPRSRVPGGAAAAAGLSAVAILLMALLGLASAVVVALIYVTFRPV